MDTSAHRTLRRTTRTAIAAGLAAALLAGACGSGEAVDPTVDPTPSVSAAPAVDDAPIDVDVRPEPGIYGPEVTAAVPLPDGPGAIAVTDGGIFVVTSNRRLVRIDPLTGQPTVVNDDFDPGGLVTGDGRLWTGTGIGALTELDVITGDATGVTLAGIGPRRRVVANETGLIALGFNRDYTPSDGKVAFENGPFQRIDPATGQITDIPVGLDTVDLLATPDAVFGVRVEDTIFRIGLDSNEVTHTAPSGGDIPDSFSPITAQVGDEIWVATKQRIDRFALADLAARGTVALPGLLVVHARTSDGTALYVVGERRLDPSRATTTIAVWKAAADGSVSAAIELGRLGDFDAFDAVVAGDSLWVIKQQDDVALRIPLDGFVPEAAA